MIRQGHEGVAGAYLSEATRALLGVDARAPAGRSTADVVVVGGGLAGLSAAYFAKRQRPEAEIVVLEAGRVGSGASGRSTGMVGPNVGGTIVALRRRYGDAMAARMFRASLEAVTTLTRLVREEALSCDLAETGQLVVARTRREAEGLRAQAESFSELGFDVPLVERDALQGLAPDARCVAALSYERAALVDPLRLCRSLRDRLATMGVPVHEQSRVTRITSGAGVRLETEGGNGLRAKKVLLATDGFSHHLGVLRRCVVPMQAHVVLTAVLPPAQLDELGWPGRQAIVESRNFFGYYRLTADNRLLFGGGRPTVQEAGSARTSAHARTWARVEQELRCRFPALTDVPIDDRWYGTIGCTLDRLPIVGPVPGLQDVWFSGAWSGHGLAMSVACAELVAGFMDDLKPAGSDLPWVRGRAPGLPPGRRLRTTGVRAYLQSLDLADTVASAVDRIETRERPSRAPAPGRARAG